MPSQLHSVRRIHRHPRQQSPGRPPHHQGGQGDPACSHDGRAQPVGARDPDHGRAGVPGINATSWFEPVCPSERLMNCPPLGGLHLGHAFAFAHLTISGFRPADGIWAVFGRVRGHCLRFLLADAANSRQERTCGISSAAPDRRELFRSAMGASRPLLGVCWVRALQPSRYARSSSAASRHRRSRPNRRCAQLQLGGGCTTSGHNRRGAMRRPGFGFRPWF